MCVQFIVFKITDDKKFIEVECKGEKTADFKEFCSKLPDGDCRYAVLDVEINTKSGATANKLIFIAWCDGVLDCAPRRGRPEGEREGEEGSNPAEPAAIGQARIHTSLWHTGGAPLSSSPHPPPDFAPPSQVGRQCLH